MKSFFLGFADELVKIAQRAPGQSLPPPTPPVTKPVVSKTPKPAVPMKVQQALPGSKMYKKQMAIAKTQPTVKPLGKTERARYRSRSDAISAMQKEQEGGGLSAKRAKYWSNIMKGF